MRKIKIDSSLISEVDSFYTSLFNGRKFSKPKTNLEELMKKRGFKIGKKHKYLKLLYDNYDTIVRLRQSEFKVWSDKFDAIIHHDVIPKKFYTKIIGALLYSKLQEKEYLIFAQQKGLKTCAYCNAALAVIVNVNYYKGRRKNVVKDRKPTFELDHFLPKSKFPFLATSFFNLLPSCSSCNKAKWSNLSDFYLYTEGNDIEVFKFWLDKLSEQKYWKSKNKEDLIIGYNYLGKSTNFKEKFDKMFSIQSLYDTQKDIVEELIHKKEAYSNAYKSSLVSSLTSIFPDKAIIDRLIIGNYSRPEEIHKRPFSKFTQDIAEHIGLIKL